jgi:hypothetical protein
VSEQRNSQWSSIGPIPVTITFPRDRFSVTATQYFLDESSSNSSTDVAARDGVKNLCEMRRAQILEQSTLTLLHMVPKGSHLSIRSDSRSSLLTDLSSQDEATWRHVPACLESRLLFRDSHSLLIFLQGMYELLIS